MDSCGTRVQEPHNSRAEILPDRERGVGTRAKDLTCMCMGVNTNWRRATNRLNASIAEHRSHRRG